jgi:hypothetical protein
MVSHGRSWPLSANRGDVMSVHKHTSLHFVTPATNSVGYGKAIAVQTAGFCLKGEISRGKSAGELRATVAARSHELSAREIGNRCTTWGRLCSESISTETNISHQQCWRRASNQRKRGRRSRTGKVNTRFQRVFLNGNRLSAGPNRQECISKVDRM